MIACHVAFLRRLSRGILAIALAVLGAFTISSCEEGPGTPIFTDEIRVLTPPDGEPRVALHPSFSWTGPSGTMSFELRLGTARDALETVANEIAAPPLVLTDPLRANREYFWQIVGHDGTEPLESPVWRFITINPGYADPTTARGALENLFKLWEARDAVALDSLLADDYRYVPTQLETTEPLDREEELRALRGIFQSSRVLVTTLEGATAAIVDVRPSDDLRFPAEDGFWKGDLIYQPFGFLWQEIQGDTTYVRLPTPAEITCCAASDEADCDPNSGAVAILESSWTTSGGKTVYKLRFFESFYNPYGSAGGHCNGVSPSPVGRLRRMGWGQLKEFGLIEEERW